MGNRIICISRQFGSGGHEISVKTADLLRLRVYEKELVHLACEYGELSESVMSDSDEKATNPYLFRTVHEGNYHVVRGKPTSEVLFALQSHEIRRIARREECVFVGRCADYALAGRPGLLRIFCRADLGQRIRRIEQRHNLSKKKAALLVAKTDRHRRVYYHHHTGQFWGHSSCYDLTVNTGVLGVEKTAETMEAFIRTFWEQD